MIRNDRLLNFIKHGESKPGSISIGVAKKGGYYIK